VHAAAWDNGLALAVRAAGTANAVAAQPPRADALMQARAGLRTAQAGLLAARLALAQTHLLAPAAGVIVTVAGHVREAPGQSGAAFITMITFAGGSP
jgi:multidrug resistance efflux pump